MIAVQGMTRTGCEQRIHQSLEALDGVREVAADHQAGRVRIAFDADTVSLDAIEDRIRNVGYTIPA